MAISLITLRIHAGFNANAFLCGLLSLGGQTSGTATLYLKRLFPGVETGVRIEPVWVQGIAGRTLFFDLAPEHPHRSPADIFEIYERSRISEEAFVFVRRTWETLARAEARVHGMAVEDVHFHEVGRLSNILAVGLAAQCWVNAGRPEIVASPLPMGDGSIKCAHGDIPYPAPALQAMLEGAAVRPWSGTGEAVSPTGFALLKGLGARFGGWPRMTVRETLTVYTPARFEGVANGTIFASGEPLPREEDD